MLTLHCLELVYCKNYFSLRKNICFEAIRVLKIGTEVGNQILSGWELQTMWNLQKNV